jgi:hypothetical protein
VDVPSISPPATAPLQNPKERILSNYLIEPEDTPQGKAMAALGEALQYPVDPHGRVYDVRYLAPVLAYHLARAGIGPVEGQAVIKPRKLPPSPGVYEDAIEWVHVSAPDGIEDELVGATLDDLNRLSPAARAEFVRRAGGNPGVVAQPDLDARTPWHVQTNIQFDD